MKTDEYLEEIVKESFNRELEVNENVARTLPFFTASLAVAVPLYGYIAARIPALAPSALCIALYGLLAAGCACGAMILWNLFGMVRLREYRIPPKETEQIAWTEALKAYFEGQGLTAATVDKKVTQQLRSRMILEYAAAAEHNRDANTPKLRARTAGVTFFVVMLAIAFAMIAIIFLSERLAKPRNQDSVDVVTQSEIERTTEGWRRPANSAETTGSAIGGEIPRRAGSQFGAEGRSEMSNTDKPSSNMPPQPANTPANSSPPSPTADLPAAPQHQLLKKSQ